MRKLTVFNFVSLNGYFKGLNGDISWAKRGDEEENKFAIENAKKQHLLLFGRITYQMMAGFWPSPMALQHNPVMAAEINKAEKIVFSRTLDKADWGPTTIIKNNMIEEVRKLKQQPGKDMTVLGSGSIITQLANTGLIDEYSLSIHPVAIGDGTSLLKGIVGRLNLELVSTQAFKSGVITLNYRVAHD